MGRNVASVYPRGYASLSSGKPFHATYGSASQAGQLLDYSSELWGRPGSKGRYGTGSIPGGSAVFSSGGFFPETIGRSVVFAMSDEDAVLVGGEE